MRNYSQEWLQSKHKEHKQLLIDKGVIVEGCDITGKGKFLHGKGGERNSYNVMKGKLPKADTQTCLMCDKQAHHWHHNVSYKTKDLDKVIPLCRSCHRHVHIALKTGDYYRLTKDELVELYKTYERIETISELLGMSPIRLYSRLCLFNITKECIPYAKKKRQEVKKKRQEVKNEKKLKLIKNRKDKREKELAKVKGWQSLFNK